MVIFGDILLALLMLLPIGDLMLKQVYHQRIMQILLICAILYHLLIFHMIGFKLGLAGSLTAIYALQCLLLSALILWQYRKNTPQAPLSKLFILWVPYGIGLALLGILIEFILYHWSGSPPLSRISTNLDGKLISLHIYGALLGYGLLELGAISALAVLIKRRILKMGAGSSLMFALSQKLPAMQEGAHLQRLFLKYACIILGMTILSGMVVNWVQHGDIFTINHKILLGVFGFILGIVIYGFEYWRGIGGSKFAMALLIIYLIFSLALPGVHLINALIS